MKYLAYLLLAITIGFNLWLNFPEPQIIADPNDNIFQYSLVYRTNWIWENYGCPLSLSCLPNLTDHVVTTWAEGYPLPFYYSHIPQIAIVSSYHLIIKPLSSLITSHLSLYQYYNWTKYLLLTLFPIPVFIALRLVGFSPLLSVLGAFFSAHFSTDGLYGIDPPSFLWRGYGLTSQLYAIFFFPLALAFTYRALKEEKNPESEYRNPKQIQMTKIQNSNQFWSLGPLIFNIVSNFVFRVSNLFWAAIFLTLTTAGHLGIGIIGILSTLPFLFLDLNKIHILKRAKILFFVYCLLFIALAYWLIPILLNTNYHMISFWDPIWKFNSYGWYEVFRQFIQGEIFDWQRFPIITILATAGFLSLLINRRLFVFSLLFGFWFLLYFGRTTWGGLLDLIPGMKDFHQHRFIVGIQIAALFLIPAGLDYIFRLIRRISHFAILAASSKFKVGALWASSKLQLKVQNFQNLPKTPQGWPAYKDSPRVEESVKIKLVQTIAFYTLSLTFISVIAYFTARQTYNYAKLNNQWIDQANNAYLYDEKNFQELTAYLQALPQARLYAGRPGNWGKQFRLGSTEMYMLFGVAGFDMSQFLPETWSPLSENEQNFDERVVEDYDLLNIRYIVSPKNEGFPDKAKMVKQFGPFQLYEVPTSGWFDVVTSPMFVTTDKTNFINLVQLWHRSYPRRWKMHPIISVEKQPVISAGMQKIVKMVDEVSYKEISPSRSHFVTPGRWPDGLLPGGESSKDLKNIFTDYPFVFPEATVSAKITKETVDKQTYSAQVEIPQNCKQCMVMFKMSYHPDWLGKVDGKPAARLAVFPFYLATPVTPGSHLIGFYYQPNKLKIILLIAEITVVIIFLLVRRRIFLPLKQKTPS